MNEGQNGGTGFGTGNFGVSSGNSVPGNMNMGAGQGDIVLAPEKKSRKGLIIALVVAVLIIGGMFVMVLSSSLFSGGNIGVNVSDDAKLAFNRYANYLLYGKDSDVKLDEEYDESEIYKFDEMRSEDAQEVTNYFDAADKLLTNFEVLLNKSQSSDLKEQVNEYRGDFELVKLTFNKEYVSDDELMAEVLNNDADTVKKWVKNKYAELEGSDYEKVKEYSDLAIEYYDAYVDYLEGAKVADCLSVEDSIVCDWEGSNDAEELVEQKSASMDDLKLASYVSVVENCWTIEDLLYKGVKDEA